MIDLADALRRSVEAARKGGKAKPAAKAAVAAGAASDPARSPHAQGELRCRPRIGFTTEARKTRRLHGGSW